MDHFSEVLENAGVIIELVELEWTSLKRKLYEKLVFTFRSSDLIQLLTLLINQFLIFTNTDSLTHRLTQ